MLAVAGVAPRTQAQPVVGESQACPEPPADQPVAFRGPVSLVLSTDTGRHVFSTEIAYEMPQRNRGMMFRPTLAEDQAMLFVANQTTGESFFMRNTCVSLDLVWVSETFRVVGVHANAVPFDETSIASPEPVRYVLEIPGGRAEEIGLKPGDVMLFGEPEASPPSGG